MSHTASQRVVAHAPNLKAVIFECERNPLAQCLPGFERIAATLARGGQPA
jgi:hypothetical protein